MEQNLLSEFEEDKYELYDRNIRLWGKENQSKLNKSHVLLINLNTAISELAKNLILSGVNLYLYDKDSSGNNHKISISDVNSNYFLSFDLIQAERVSELKTCFQKLNSYTEVKEIDSLDCLDDIHCVCIGFTNFQKMVKYIIIK
jgi:molybdopterin/thiamine biosynthesis adenylyltransferase